MDEGKRALMCFSEVRTLSLLKHFAKELPPYATVGVSQALLDRFFQEVFPVMETPIILVTSDYNSDRSAPKPFSVDHSSMLDHSRVAHWFSDNWIGGQHPKLSLMPIGINDRHVRGEPRGMQCSGGKNGAALCTGIVRTWRTDGSRAFPP